MPFDSLGLPAEPVYPVEHAVLKRARDLLAAGWCRNHYAIDENGFEVSSLDRSAKLFCAVGAIYRALDDLKMPMLDPDSIFIRLAPALAAATGRTTEHAMVRHRIIKFNDGSLNRTRVLRLFDTAIAEIEAEARDKARQLVLVA